MPSCNSSEEIGEDPVPDPDPQENVVTLEMDVFSVQLYTHPLFNESGRPDHYDYFISFGQAGKKLPFLEFDIFLPTTEGLVEGTYTMESGLLGNVFYVENAEDLKKYDNWEDPYELQEASVQLINNGRKNWTIKFRATTGDGRELQLDYTANVNIIVDDVDPMGGGGVSDTFNKESTETTTQNISFTTLESSSDYLADKGYMYYNLESAPINAAGDIYVCELYFRTDSKDYPLGSFPIAGDNAGNQTYVRSHGDTAGGFFPSFIGIWNPTERKMKSVWYLDEGYITFAYNMKGEIIMDGDVTSHYGSKLYFVYNIDISKLDKASSSSVSRRAHKVAAMRYANVKAY